MASARVHHVKKARKSNKNLGIKKGQEYWWWKFRYGGKHISHTKPAFERAEQLTEHQGNMRDFENRKDKLENDWEGTLEEWNAEKEELEGAITEWLDELNSRKDNLPEQFQETHILNEQIEEIENIENEVQSLSEPDEVEED